MRNGFRIVVGILLTIGLLAGCGGGSLKQGESDKATEPKPVEQKPAAPARLVIGAHQDIRHWDLHNHNYTFTEAVHQNVFDYLVRMNPETGEFTPELAVSWKLVEPTVWEFKLRTGVKFQNGDPFTAEDVKFTVERVATTKDLVENRTMNSVKEVRIVDPTTVQIITNQPDPALLNRLSRIGSGIMPKQYWEKVGGLTGWQKAPIGTGPYKFKEWVKDDHVTLEAFAEHWRGAPPVKEVVVRVLPETATRVAELQAGGIDIALKVGIDNAKQLQQDSKLTAATGLTNRVWVLMVRTQQGQVTSDPRVREAIELAIDRKALVDVAEPGLGKPTRTRVTPGITGADPSLYDAGAPDPEKAKKLLAEAGLAAPVKIGFLARSGGADAVVAQTVAGMLERVGFKVNLELVDATAFTNKLSAATTPEIYLNAFGNSMKDAEVAFNLMTEKADLQRLGYSPADAVSMLTATRAEMDVKKRAELFQKIGQRVAADRAQIALFQSGDVHGVRKGIQWKPARDEMLWVYDMKFGD